MMTVSDDGERTCPLCAEEMDLTDQQLKPCKCGYEICVWCWHHIIDLAEKEETSGRCPACRTPYDKERIVAMASNCERVVAERNAEKKQRGSKVKAKASVEAKKHLTSVRVIQRNLVYIIGLPCHLCDESILERKEYFGQYGKVLKVSVSRSAGSQQTSSNNTFSVYITYAKEEEAVRCIQSVHNYVLDGKALRACFGTTKYCHAWLRNMACNNPDCLYLHDVGTQEDSFTKDEIISAYTRTRVPQIGLNNTQQRSGSFLPPPLDDFSPSGVGSVKSQAKISSNSTLNQHRGSPPNCSGKPVILPAAASWGLRPLNSRPSTLCSSTLPVKLKAETNVNSSLSPLLVEDEKQPSAWNDEMVITRKIPENNLNAIMASKASESRSSIVNKSPSPPSLMENPKFSPAWHDYEAVGTSNEVENRESLKVLSNQIEPFKLGSWQDNKVTTSLKKVEEGDFVSRSSAWNDMASRSKQGNLSSAPDDKEEQNPIEGNKIVMMTNHLPKGVDSSKASPEISKICNTSNGALLSLSSNLPLIPSNDESTLELLKKAFPDPVGKEQGDLNVELPRQDIYSSIIGKDDPILPFGNKISRVADSTVHMVPTIHSNSGSWNTDVGSKRPSVISVNTDKQLEPSLLPPAEDTLPDNQLSNSSVSRKVFECPEKNCIGEKLMPVGKSGTIGDKSSELGIMGESNIISDILQLDFDPWDDSLFSSNDLAKLLSEDAKQDSATTLSNSWKPQSSNQSRFSFAWQDNQGHLSKPLIGDRGHFEQFYSSQNAYEEGFQNGSILNNIEGPKATFADNILNQPDSSNGGSRSKMSAPPGFSAPSKATPPGFSSQDRFNQAYETAYTESSLLGDTLVGGSYQSHVAGNSGDLELSDPAIMMAVGKEQMPLNLNNLSLGLKPTFPTHLSTSDSDPRLHLLMQHSIPSHQNLRLPEHMGDRYFSVNDLFMTSQLLAQNHSSLSPFDQISLQQPRNSHFSNNQRDGWNDFRASGDIRLGEMLRTDRYGLTNYYSSNDEPKFHIPNGNLYNRAFGM